MRIAYRKNKNEIEILRCWSPGGSIRIPEKIDGSEVTAVAAYAFSDERGVMEAAGPVAAALAAYAAPGEIWRTLPGPEDHPIGCIRPLNQWAGQLMEQTVCFLNLMYN